MTIVWRLKKNSDGMEEDHFKIDTFYFKANEEDHFPQAMCWYGIVVAVTIIQQSLVALIERVMVMYEMLVLLNFV